MAFETSLQAFATALAAWQQELEALQATLQDRTEELALVEALHTAADDLLGWLFEARESCRHAGHDARGVLAESGALLARAAQHQALHLTGAARIRDLHDLTQRRPDAWKKWSGPVLRSLEYLPTLTFAAFERLLACWRDLPARVPVLN